MNKIKTMKWIRKLRDNNYNETKNMTKKELLEHYKNKAGRIHKETIK